VLAALEQRGDAVAVPDDDPPPPDLPVP